MTNPPEDITRICIKDWSNRIADPSPARLDALKRGRRLILSARALHTDPGRQVARVLAESAQLLSTIQVLQVPKHYGHRGVFPWKDSVWDLFKDKLALDEHGDPAIGYWGSDGKAGAFHIDPTKSTPQEYVELVMDFHQNLPAQSGILCDYIGRREPWVPPGALPPVGLSDPAWVREWQSYQRILVRLLRHELPRSPLVLNGAGPQMEPDHWIHPTYLGDGCLWERFGFMHDKTPEKAAARCGSHLNGSGYFWPMAGNSASADLSAWAARFKRGFFVVDIGEQDF